MATAAHRANQIIDDMITRRRAENPAEWWTRDVPFIWQERILGSEVTLADESDKGRGAPVVDLFGRVRAGAFIEEHVVSVKSTFGKNRPTGRTAIFTTGTMKHLRAIAARLMDPSVVIPVLFVHQNTANNEWAQTVFDAGAVARGIMARDGEGDVIPGTPIRMATGTRGVPMVLNATTRPGSKGKIYTYHSIRFNMSPLVTPEGLKVPRAGGRTGYGLVKPWRKVQAPTLEWE